MHGWEKSASGRCVCVCAIISSQFDNKSFQELRSKCSAIHFDLDQTTKTELNNVSGVLLHSACVQCSSKRVSSSVFVFAVVSVGKAKPNGTVRVWYRVCTFTFRISIDANWVNSVIIIMRCHPFSERRLFTIGMRPTIISHVTKSFSFLGGFLHSIHFSFCLAYDVPKHSNNVNRQTKSHRSSILSKNVCFSTWICFRRNALLPIHVRSFRPHLIHFILSAFITVSSWDLSLIFLVSRFVFGSYLSCTTVCSGRNHVLCRFL